MKAILALALFLLCAWAGSRKRARLQARLETLGGLAADMRKLRDILELTPMPIAEAAGRLGSDVWKRFIEEMQAGGAADAWKRALEEAQEYEEDRDVLEGFSEILRATQMRAQQGALALFLRELDERRGAVSSELEKKGKVYSSLGVLLGLSLALLVI